MNETYFHGVSPTLFRRSERPERWTPKCLHGCATTSSGLVSMG